MTKQPWYDRSLLLAFLKLREFQNDSRHNNLHDTSQLSDSARSPKFPKPQGDGYLVTRTEDGSYNDIEPPEMGMKSPPLKSDRFFTTDYEAEFYTQ